MRTTVDIPNALYRKLKGKAAKEGYSVRQLILSAVQAQLGSSGRSRRVKLPIIESRRPGTLDLTNEKISEIIPFP